MPLTQELAAFCATLRFDAVPTAAWAPVRTAFADTFATLVAGRIDPVAVTLREALAPSAGPCRVFVDQGFATAPDAAQLDAAAAHALDFDDAAQRGHLSVVMVPAILAEAQVLGCSGRSMLAAYAAGYETWAELIAREADHYHNHSWHPTGVFGPLAAAAACAVLRGLDAHRAAHALAIAASASAGLIANFGSMTKPLHAGQAARAGIVAARLAALGCTAGDDVLEHPKGLLRGISPAGRVDLASPVQAGRRWRLPEAGVNTKKYPTCFATHRALDGVFALIENHRIQAAEVSAIEVTTSRRNRSTLRFHEPQDALQAKFSMQFAMAAALLARRCGLLELRDDFVTAPAVRALMQRVRVEPEDREDPARPGEAPEDVVVVTTVDGRRLRQSVDYVRGGPERPLRDGELFAKFEGCLAAGGMTADAARLFDAFNRIESWPQVSTLYALAA